MLLLATTACASESDDAATESAPDTAVETTVGGNDAPATDAPGETTQAPDDPDDNSDDPVPTEPAVVVPEALRFTAPLVGGGTFDGAAAAAAGKPTVFWFWAPT